MIKYRSLCIAVIVAAQVEVRSKATGDVLFNVGDESYFRTFVRAGRCPCEFLGARQFRTYDCVWWSVCGCVFACLLTRLHFRVIPLIAFRFSCALFLYA